LEIVCALRSVFDSIAGRNARPLSPTTFLVSKSLSGVFHG
jgi:hypothetical protein